MRTVPLLTALALAATLGCNSNAPTPAEIRHDAAAATNTVVKDAKSAAEGIRDGVHNSRGGPGYDVVNINTAPRLTLMTLPGLTSAQAGRIIAHRPYRDPDDLRIRRIIPADEFDQIAPRIVTN